MATAKPARKRVTFSCYAPEARSVRLAGDFTQWEFDAIELEKQADGSWKKQVSLAPGRYEYRFLVDGQWQDDPGSPERIGNSFGSQNCVRNVG